MQSSLDLGAPPPLCMLMESGPAALFLDFDGTLVEIAAEPGAIAPIPDMAIVLRRLADRLEGRIAIVSGRAIEDIERHIGPITIAAAGSHGLDIRGADGHVLGQGAAGLPGEIEQELRDFAAQEGLDFEQKPHGGALHYRRDPALGPKAHVFAEKLAARHGWAVQSGKCVAELVAKGASKGSAVKTLMQSAPFTGAVPFFLGDDLTDETGFEMCRELGGAGIIVGADRKTAAQYHLPSVTAVHTWLEL